MEPAAVCCPDEISRYIFAVSVHAVYLLVHKTGFGQLSYTGCRKSALRAARGFGVLLTLRAIGFDADFSDAFRHRDICSDGLWNTGFFFIAADCMAGRVWMQENIGLRGINMGSYIEVKNVSKSFGHRPVLQNVSLTADRGKTVGLVGENGSGKSVLFKILCGFEKPDKGSVFVRGEALGKNGRDFPDNMGVFINAPGFIGIYSGFQNLKFLADIQRKIGEKEIRDAMNKVGLDPDNKVKVDHYSLGMKQKLGLAQAIMEGQDILVLDEPFNALDYKTYEDVKSIIRMLKAEEKTIFLTSHHYKDMEQLCDEVYLIEDCRLIPVTEEIAARYLGS